MDSTHEINTLKDVVDAQISTIKKLNLQIHNINQAYTKEITDTQNMYKSQERHSNILRNQIECFEELCLKHNINCNSFSESNNNEVPELIVFSKMKKKLEDSKLKIDTLNTDLLNSKENEKKLYLENETLVSHLQDVNKKLSLCNKKCSKLMKKNGIICDDKNELQKQVDLLLQKEQKRKTKGKQISELEKEIETLKIDLELHKRVKANFVKSEENLRDDIKYHQQLIEKLKESLKTSLDKETSQTQLLEESQNLVKSLQAELTYHVKSMKTVKSLKDKLKSLSQLVEDLQESNSSLQLEIQKKKKIISTSKEEIDALKNEVDKQKQLIIKIKKSKKAYKDKTLSLTESLEKSKKKEKELTKELNNMKQLVAEIGPNGHKSNVSCDVQKVKEPQQLSLSCVSVNNSEVLNNVENDFTVEILRSKGAIFKIIDNENWQIISNYCKNMFNELSIVKKQYQILKFKLETKESENEFLKSTNSRYYEDILNLLENQDNCLQNQKYLSEKKMITNDLSSMYNTVENLVKQMSVKKSSEYTVSGYNHTPTGNVPLQMTHSTPHSVLTAQINLIDSVSFIIRQSKEQIQTGSLTAETVPEAIYFPSQQINKHYKEPDISKRVMNRKSIENCRSSNPHEIAAPVIESSDSSELTCSNHSQRKRKANYYDTSSQCNSQNLKSKNKKCKK